MFRRLLAFAALLSVSVVVATVGGAQAEPPQATACTESATAIRAAPAAASGTQQTTGTAGDDTIFGTPGLDAITGLDGADCIDGRGNYDTLDGGPGNDLLILGDADPSGTTGTPTSTGGDGDDRLIGGTGGDELDGGPGFDVLSGGPGNDGLVDGGRRPTEADRVEGGPGNDTIVSNNGSDAIVAAEGDDRIRAANGQVDAIDCGEGTDKVDADLTDELIGCESGARTNVVRAVSPRSGRRTTRFRLRLRRSLVNDDGAGRFFSIALTAPSGSSCARGAPIAIWDSTDERSGRRIRSVRLRAPGRSRRWCRGTYSGILVQLISNPSSSCEEDQPPASCQSDTVIGTFRFRVR